MRALTPWRSGRGRVSLPDEMDSLFTRFFADDEGWWAHPLRSSLIPAIESFVRDNELVIRADLPGINPKDVELAVENGQLTIRGERRRVSEDSDHLTREVSYGKFERTLALPSGVDTESVKATYHDGVLEVTVKAPKELVPRKVPISVH